MGSDSVLEVTEQNFTGEVSGSNIPVLLDFWAEWCGPCKMIAPLVSQLATEYQGRVKIGKVNVDTEQNLAVQFGISSIPTLLIFKGGQVVGQIVGAKPLKELKGSLDRVLAG